MIKKYSYGTPFQTDTIITPLETSASTVEFGSILLSEGFQFTYKMADNDIVYGLGEANRGINKRGFIYDNDCFDNPHQTEEQRSFYAAHNFIIIDGTEHFGMYFDYPGKITFDIGYTLQDTLTVSCENADLNLYVITGDTSYDIVKQFRKIIGRSYIPPKYAFGFGQSRWGYKARQDFENVVTNYRENHIPIDMLYMDIDYMDSFKDFTVNEDEFSDFEGMVNDMQKKHIHLIPIIDAGVKIEDSYDIYEEGKENSYFCKREDGTDFEAAVWPGLTHFPDVLNPDARAWFGSKYERLISKGIDGFWNDMCEPAIFYTPEGVAEYKNYLKNDLLTSETFPNFDARTKAEGLANSPEDYKRFYHNINGKMVRHDKVHNLYGMNMTRAAFEGLEKLEPNKRFLLFSRSSFIGAHRYGGVWTGDNCSWWSHLLLNIKMMPSLNMCGFLYAGADIGGFGSNTTRDLLLRWLAFGVFTPLMRNHSAIGTRNQECYSFEHIEDFRHVVGVRYRLLPYIYSEFMKAAISDDMYCKPLAFEYSDDNMCRQVEDQLMIGNEIMITPVYTQNTSGRYVYLPEEMKFIKFMPNGTISETVLDKGHHYIEVQLNEVPLFIRRNKCIPIVNAAECVDDIDISSMKMIGYTDADYDLYDDDGISIIR
ncbi:MAG: alpha-glucosidase [Lachnospiraceae bacterium]|nr:alpha-glucosidase [Lachnospiraceae bacterium]